MKRAVPLTQRALHSSGRDTQMPTAIKQEARLKCPKGAKQRNMSLPVFSKSALCREVGWPLAWIGSKLVHPVRLDSVWKGM